MFLFIELALWIIVTTLCVSFDKGWFAFWATVGAGVALWATGVPILEYVMANPQFLAGCALAYITAGGTWATLKFIIKLRKARNLYMRDKTAWLNAPQDAVGACRSGDWQPRTEAQWIQKCQSSHSTNSLYLPTVNGNKENIMFWAWWWPFSAISFLFEDLLREIWNATWRMMRAWLEAIRRNVLGEAAKDLEN